MDLEKHLKIQENLKVLHSYIKKKRAKPHDESTMIKDEGSLLINDGYSRSDKPSSRRTESSKRHRRSYNKSRLYQDEKKLFEDIFKHKNNQSLDTKIDKQFKGHLKYNLLSEDKETDTKQCSLYENITKKYQPALKKKIIQADNYFSAPSSTKEKNTQKLNIKKKEETKDTTKTEPVPDETTAKGDPKVASPAENQEDTGRYDIQIPKTEDIENIFQDQDTSPKDKVIHMSVIHSMDNFEEVKNQENANSEPEEEPQPKNTASDKSNKAAVPILDLKILSEKKSAKAYEDPFDKESHLDLSSKRIKKLILTSDFSSLLHIREEVINKKADEEKDEIKNLLNQKKISPRTSKERTLRLEKWVTKEKEDINKTKKIIEEATRKTEDIIKDAQNNGNLLKQIMTEKITPRDNIRSGIHSERKRYEEMQKMSSSEHARSDLDQSSQSHDRSDHSQNPSNLNDAQDAPKINKEIDLTNKNLSNEIKSNSDANISVDTPLIPSDDHESSFNNAGKVVLGPQKAEGDSSEDSKEEILDSNKPISLEIK